MKRRFPMTAYRFLRTALSGLTVATLAFCLVQPAAAVPSKPKTPQISENAEASKLYETGKKEADQDLFAAALERFEAAAALDPDNPDILNMLAYSQRKTGLLEQAIENYHRALELRPEFPEAREYLGEAYIQAALREIETLTGYGSKAEHELEELVEALKAAAAQF